MINGQEITANRIFDSRPLQYPRGVSHFVGLKIQTNQKIFDPSTLFMDFHKLKRVYILFISFLFGKITLIESTVL